MGNQNPQIVEGQTTQAINMAKLTSIDSVADIKMLYFYRNEFKMYNSALPRPI
jgi:hypothetical protein